MKRSGLVLASVSSAVAVALVVLIYGMDSPRSSSTAGEPRRGEANEARQTSPIGIELNDSAETGLSKSTGVVQSLSSDVSQERTPKDTSQTSVVIFSRDGGIADEDETREGVKKFATYAVRNRYNLLLQDLNLSQRQREALFELLVEYEIASTLTPYRTGETIDKEQRANRIATIVGDSNLRQFQELESIVDAYAEVKKMESLLQTYGVPVTDEQHRELLEFVAETQNRYLELPIAIVDSSSVELLERQRTQISEYERHLMELAPSVLSAQQVVYLDEQYQHFAYLGANAWERYRQELADGASPEDVQLLIPTWLGE